MQDIVKEHAYSPSRQVFFFFKRKMHLKRVTAVKCTLQFQFLSFSDKVLSKWPFLIGTLFAHEGLSAAGVF